MHPRHQIWGTTPPLPTPPYTNITPGDISPASDIWWWSLQTCSNLLIWGPTSKWHLVVTTEHMWCGMHFYWNNFLLLIPFSFILKLVSRWKQNIRFSDELLPLLWKKHHSRSTLGNSNPSAGNKIHWDHLTFVFNTSGIYHLSFQYQGIRMMWENMAYLLPCGGDKEVRHRRDFRIDWTEGCKWSLAVQYFTLLLLHLLFHMHETRPWMVTIFAVTSHC